MYLQHSLILALWLGWPGSVQWRSICPRTKRRKPQEERQVCPPSKSVSSSVYRYFGCILPHILLPSFVLIPSNGSIMIIVMKQLTDSQTAGDNSFVGTKSPPRIEAEQNYSKMEISTCGRYV